MYRGRYQQITRTDGTCWLLLIKRKCYMRACYKYSGRGQFSRPAMLEPKDTANEKNRKGGRGRRQQLHYRSLTIFFISKVRKKEMEDRVTVIWPGREEESLPAKFYHSYALRFPPLLLSLPRFPFPPSELLLFSIRLFTNNPSGLVIFLLTNA